MKHGFVDLAAILFVIGGIVSLAMTILTIPISSIYPLSLPTSFTASFIVVLAVELIASIGAIHCAQLAMRRMLSEAGIQGIIFGALLLIFSLGVTGATGTTAASVGTGTGGSGTTLTAISSILILIAGIICFALRHTSVSASPIARQHAIAQPAFQQ
ncbi:MAG TPA: hypothetical protein VLV31_08640 [Candidatus Acidoferrales bacterium]|nr:hypothetical protein [Candidatus Acidoferrales bacterium]